MGNGILFLCTGNTCRSPLAEALAGNLFGGLGLEFGSAGLEARAGQPASDGSLLAAHAIGLSLADHRSRPVTVDLLADAAWVVGMTRSHAAIFRSRFGGAFAGRLGVLGAPGGDLMTRRHSPRVEEVRDPLGGAQEQYRRMGIQMERLLTGWAEVFTELAQDKERKS